MIFKTLRSLTGLVISICLASMSASAQTPSYEQAEKRVQAFEQRLKQCDEPQSEGDLATCCQSLREDLEIEIRRLSKEVKSTLPKSARARFDQADKAWQKFYALESSHYTAMLEVQGAVHHIGFLESLVDLQMARCHELIWQLYP